MAGELGMGKSAIRDEESSGDVEILAGVCAGLGGGGHMLLGREGACRRREQRWRGEFGSASSCKGRKKKKKPGEKCSPCRNDAWGDGGALRSGMRWRRSPGWPERAARRGERRRWRGAPSRRRRERGGEKWKWGGEEGKEGGSRWSCARRVVAGRSRAPRGASARARGVRALPQAAGRMMTGGSQWGPTGPRVTVFPFLFLINSFQ